MGTIRTVIEDQPNFRVVQLGGAVNYSWEFWYAMSKLPKTEVDRIVADLEYQHRVRRVIEYNPLVS